MTDNVPTTLETTNGLAALDRYLDAEDPQSIVGKLLKFAKGEYLKGIDSEVVPVDTVLAVACDATLVGLIRWEDGKPAEHRLVRIMSGTEPPCREELGYHDRGEWPKDAKGDPRDPWQPTMYVPMMDTEGELFTFTTGSSKSAAKSLQRLLRRYSTHAKRHPNVYPLVRLKIDFYMHSDRSIGKVFYPTFESAGYVDKLKFCEALEAVGIAVEVPAPAALPSAQDEMSDEIPF